MFEKLPFFSIKEIWFSHLLNDLRDNVDLFENINEQFLDFLQVKSIESFSFYHQLFDRFQLQIDWTKQSKIVLDHFGSFQMALISWNTKYAQRYLSFIFTLFTIPGDKKHEFWSKQCQSFFFNRRAISNASSTSWFRSRNIESTRSDCSIVRW